jgi:hypothetical protein
MKTKGSLMAAMVGLAMLATPITAAAYDHNRNYNNNAHSSHSYVAPARNYSAPATRNYVRNGSNYVTATRPYAAGRGWGNVNEYRHYGRPGYYSAPAPVYGAAAPVYAAPAYAAPAYAAPSYAGGNGSGCGAAHSVMYNYRRDQATGHPAAAYDLLRQNQWAFHSGCNAAPYAGRVMGGYSGAPAYGYGQPYGGGSFLTPLLGQFVR